MPLQAWWKISTLDEIIREVPFNLDWPAEISFAEATPRILHIKLLTVIDSTSLSAKQYWL
jgi:hypothetical protein